MKTAPRNKGGRRRKAASPGAAPLVPGPTRRVALVYLLNVSGAPRFSRLERAQARPGLGLRYLKAALEREGVAVDIFDALYDVRLARAIPGILNRGRYDLAGFYCSTGSLGQVIEAVGRLDRGHYRGRVLAGGPGAIHAGELLRAGVDLVVHGEGEEIIRRIVTARREDPAALAALPGLSFAAPGGGVVFTGPPRIVDLARLPFPAWGDGDGRHGPLTDVTMRRPVYWVMASRGCPYRCAFCDRTGGWRTAYRARPVAHVLEELAWLVARHGARHVEFNDDLFGLAPGWVDDLCEGIARRGLDLTWSAIVHPKSFHADRRRAFTVMRTAGCRLLYFGAQSADPGILAGIDRDSGEPADLADAFAACRAAGIASAPIYIVGLPGETRETFVRTLRHVTETRPTTPIFAPVLYLPGTALMEKRPPPAEQRRLDARNRRWVREAYARYYLGRGGAAAPLWHALAGNRAWFTQVASYAAWLAGSLAQIV